MLRVGITAVCALTALAYYNMPKIVPWNVERLARSAMAIADSGVADLELIDDPEKRVERDRPERVHFIGQLVLYARMKWGLLEFNEPNRLMVRKYLLDICERHGVRPGHIATMLDTAVALSFTPLKSDIEEKQIWASKEVLVRNVAMKARYVSSWNFLGLGRLFERSS